MSKNEKEKQGRKEIHIHTTITERTKELLDKYKDFQDEKSNFKAKRIQD